MRKCLLLICLCLVVGTNTAFAKQHIDETVILSISDRESWTEHYLDFESRYKNSDDQESMYKTYQAQFEHIVKSENEDLHIFIRSYLREEGQAKSAYYAVVYGLRAHMLEQALTRLKKEILDLLQQDEVEEAVRILDDTSSWITNVMDPTLQQWDNQQSSWTYTDLHTVLLPALRESVVSGNQNVYELYVQMIENVLYKVFLMDVITGVQDEKKHLQSLTQTGNLADDDRQLKISPDQVRAMFAFYPLKNWIQNHDAEFAKEQAESLFKNLQNHPRFGFERVQERITSALHAIVHHELQMVFFTDLQQGNHHQALVRAADAVSTTSLLEVAGVGWEQEDRFRFVQYHGERFFFLLQQGEFQEAKEAAFNMLKELVRFKGVFFRIGEPQLMMDGEALKLGQMASYLDPSTNRTLVSARFFAESLGASVMFDANQKTVNIIRNGDSIRLQIGSKDIYRNDHKEDQTLDQTVVLWDGRTYIPLRAAAELLGHQIFWHKGEIVIH